MPEYGRLLTTLAARPALRLVVQGFRHGKVLPLSMAVMICLVIFTKGGVAHFLTFFNVIWLALR